MRPCIHLIDLCATLPDDSLLEAYYQMTRGYCADLEEQKPNSHGLLQQKGKYMRCSACRMMLHKDFLDEAVAKDPWTCPTRCQWGVPLPKAQNSNFAAHQRSQPSTPTSSATCHQEQKQPSPQHVTLDGNSNPTANPEPKPSTPSTTRESVLKEFEGLLPNGVDM